MIILKTDADIEKLRESNRLVAEFHKIVIEKTVPGITTMELNALAEQYALKNKALPAFKGYRGFPFSICASKNHEIVHGFPDNEPLEEGTILSIDYGILKNGFYGDAAITIGVGSITKENQKLIKTTKECLDLAIHVAKPGNYTGDIGYIISSHAERSGYQVIKDFIGHGIGRDLHEKPAVKNYGNKKTGVRLKEGMVICIEPMLVRGSNKTKTLDDGWTVIAADKSNSAHFEHCIHITSNGPEILSI